MARLRPILLAASLFALLSAHIPTGSNAEEGEGPLWSGTDVELTVMMEYISRVLGKRFIYEPSQLKGRKIAVLSTTRIPKESVYGIFQSILRMNGFVLIDYRDYVRVERAQSAKLQRTPVFTGTGAQPLGEDRIITRVFPLKAANANTMNAVLRQLLSPEHEQAVALPESNTLVVTGFASNLERIASVVEASDQEGPKTSSEYVELKHAKADDVSKQLQPLLKGLTSKRALLGTRSVRMSPAQVIAVPRSNALIMVGTGVELDELKGLTTKLDVPGLKTQTQCITLEHGRAPDIARHLDPLVKAFAAARGKPGPKHGLPAAELTADPRTNTIVVTATEEEVKSVQALVQQLDIDVPTLESTIRVFKVQNADAEELAAVLTQVLRSGAVSSPGARAAATKGGAKAGTSAAARPAMDLEQDLDIVAQRGTIIVRAPVAVLERVALLLKELDVRKPKVLIEAAIVELRVSKDFDLGVELASVDRPTGDPRFFGSTSVGISSLLDTDNDGVIDARVPIPGPGVVAGIFKNSFGDIPLLIKALEQKTAVRVLAAPMVIADDNEEATFTAAEKVPVATFTTTQSTTDVVSFGKFEEAKIELKIKPNINEEEGYLRLQIDQIQEAFQGDPVSANLPPSKITRELHAVLTVPDRRTVAVGGLSNNRIQRGRRGVPILQHIPLIGVAFRGKNKDDLQTRLYIFVKTTILKDLSFEDYQKLSQESKERMEEFREKVIKDID